MSEGRVPPHNLEAEEAVLGSMLISPKACDELLRPIGEVALYPEAFYKGAHVLIFETLHQMYKDSEPIDPITVAGALETRGCLHLAGGRSYLHALVAMVPTPVNAVYYARIILRLAQIRQAIAIANELVETCAQAPALDVFGAALSRASEQLRLLSGL